MLNLNPGPETPGDRCRAGAVRLPGCRLSAGHPVTRVAGKVLQLWREKLSGRERSLLMDYSPVADLDGSDPFHSVDWSPQSGGLDGPLLKGPKTFHLHTADKKAFYRSCVKLLNRS